MIIEANQLYHIDHSCDFTLRQTAGSGLNVREKWLSDEQFNDSEESTSGLYMSHALETGFRIKHEWNDLSGSVTRSDDSETIQKLMMMMMMIMMMMMMMMMLLSILLKIN